MHRMRRKSPTKHRSPLTIACEEIVQHGCVIARISIGIISPAHIVGLSVIACCLWEISVIDIIVSVSDCDVIIPSRAADL